MALTFTTNSADRSVEGNRFMTFGTVAFDDSYPTGGESYTAPSLGLYRVDRLVVAPKSGYIFEVDHTNAKILVYWAGTAGGPDTEVTAATNLSTLTGVQWMAWGA